MPTANPILLINPRSDIAFVERARQLVRAGTATPQALQAQLRLKYGDAQVHERGLENETSTWYVYRDGGWVASGS